MPKEPLTALALDAGVVLTRIKNQTAGVCNPSPNGLHCKPEMFKEMEFPMIRTTFVVVAMFAVLAFMSQSASAQIGNGNLPDSLFSQYTTQGQGGTTAGQYPAPHPVPSHVGHNYYTYQPLMPHEMLYEHQRNYYNYYNDNSYYGGGGSLNVTSVRWQNGHGGFRPLPFSNKYISQLQYGIAKRAYGIDGGGGLNIGNRDLLNKLKARCPRGNCDTVVGAGDIISDGGCATCGGN